MCKEMHWRRKQRCGVFLGEIGRYKNKIGKGGGVRMAEWLKRERENQDQILFAAKGVEADALQYEESECVLLICYIVKKTRWLNIFQSLE